MKDYVAVAAQYQVDVLSGVVPACKWVQLACERNRRDLDRQESEGFPYRFDFEAGRTICRFAEMLPHVKGDLARIVGYAVDGDERRPIWNTITLEPWQCWILTTVFGWKHAAGSVDATGASLEGKRRFRIALSLIPRKNAKSTLAAIVVLYMLVADGESGAECYSAATTRDQAKAIAEIAWEMVRRSPEFRANFGVRLGSKTTLTLTVPANIGKFAPLSADANSLDGLNVSLAAIDELHAHRTAAVWNVLDTATGARRQPLIFAITTAGVDIGGVCHQKMAYLEKILESVYQDETFFGINYTIDPGDDVRDPMVHRKANPNYGVSVDPDDLARKIHAAQQTQDDLNDKLTKHFNVWIRAESTYVPMRELIALGDSTLKIEDFADYPCWIGVDLAEIRDIAAAVALFRPDPQTYVAFGRFYLPARAVSRSPIASLHGWVRQGHIIETEGDQSDYLRIEDDLVNWCDHLNDVREIDFDRALAAQMGQSLKRRFTPRMGKDGVENFVITVNQNVETMNPAMQMVNGLILSGHFKHEGNPAFNWQWSNVVVERNHKGEVYPRKAGGKDSPNHIDGAVALYTCFSRASQADIRPKRKRQGAKIYTPGGFVPALPVEGARDQPVV